MMIKKLSYSCFMCLVMATALNAQDPIQNLREFPPTHQSKGDLSLSMESLDWQLTQKRSLMESYQVSQKDISKSVEKIDRELQEMKEQLEHAQLIDEATRSRLAGKLMEEILDAKLELAAIKAVADLLEQKSNSEAESEIQKLRVRDLENTTKISESRYHLAKSECEEATKLYKKGATSEQNLKRAQHSMEVSLLEYNSCKAKLKIASLEGKSGDAQTLTRSRIKSAPVMARIQHAESVLAEYQKTGTIMDAIARRSEERDLWRSDMQMIAGQMSKVAAEIMELENLKRLIEIRLSESKGTDKKAEK